MVETRRGFTLIELLVVIGILGVLMAIIFPVFFTARAKARQTVCLSNLRQIGTAIAMYSTDADDYFPYGLDPSDKFTPIWTHNPDYAAQLADMPMLQDLLSPYTHSLKIWQCTADIGFDELDLNFNGGVHVPLDARPTAFEKYGTSYFYRTELALKHKRYAATDAYEPTPPYADRGPGDVNVVMDGHGSWHGGFLFNDKRYNILMGDGRVINQNVGQFARIWNLRLEPGGTTP